VVAAVREVLEAEESLQVDYLELVQGDTLEPVETVEAEVLLLAAVRCGEIRLIEVAARGGGVFISSDLIPLCCGLDVNALLIQRSLGASVSVDHTSIIEAAASGYICFTLPEGVIDQPPNIKEVEEIEGVYRTHLEDLVPGRKIHNTMDKTKRLGPILIRAESRDDLDKIHKRVKQVLHITVATPDGVCGPIWS